MLGQIKQKLLDGAVFTADENTAIRFIKKDFEDTDMGRLDLAIQLGLLDN